MFSEKIFKAYDIRGEFGKDFDASFAKKLGGVLVEYLGAKKLVVSRDTRSSSGDIAKEIIDGVVSSGCDIIDLGTTSAPLFYFGVINEGADGGVMVTASHLGDEFNGFKITKKNAVVVGGDELLESAKDLFEKDVVKTGKKGEVSSKSILEEYVKSSIKLSWLEPGEISTAIRFIGDEMILAEFRAVASALKINVVESGEEIGFELDADGDRLMILNPSGRKIRGDLIGGLLAGYYFEGKKVIYDPRYSRGVLEYLKSKSIEAILSRVGHKLVKDLMRKRDAEFCGEQSGHIYFKEAGFIEAPALAVLKILKILQETGKSIDELANSVSSWSTTEEINFDIESRDKISEILEKTKERYSDGNINDADGIRVEYPNWGFLLRPSNTEAKLRLIVDAREPGLLDEKKEELLELLK